MAIPVSADGFTLDLADVKAALNIQDNLTKHDAELSRFIAGAEAHIRRTIGDVASSSRIASVTASGGTLLLPVWPVQAVQSITSLGTSYTTPDLVVSQAGVVSLASGGRLVGSWTVTYTAGETDTADLYLAALEDIRGLWQGGQLGPASIGALGAARDEETGVSFRPLLSWPRIDAWAAARSVSIA